MVLGDCLQNGSPYAIRPLSVLSCLCLSVTLVCCGQTIGWIKMKLGPQVALGPGHIVLDADPAPLPQRSTAAQFLAHSVMAKLLDGLRCHLVWSRPRPRRLCVRWGPSSPPQKGGGALLPNFWPMSIVVKQLDG